VPLVQLAAEDLKGRSWEEEDLSVDALELEDDAVVDEEERNLSVWDLRTRENMFMMVALMGRKCDRCHCSSMDCSCCQDGAQRPVSVCCPGEPPSTRKRLHEYMATSLLVRPLRCIVTACERTHSPYAVQYLAIATEVYKVARDCPLVVDDISCPEVG
jgi:hypothetical protein